MIRETTDTSKVNEILNAPSVIDGASMHTGIKMDAGAVLLAGGTVLENEYGGFLLVPTAPHEYEAHMFFLPEGRGKKAVEAAHEGLKIMFSKGAKKITARIPLGYRASRLLTKRIGFKSVGIGMSDYGVGTYESEFLEMTECPR